MPKRTIHDTDLGGKRVFVRVDYNLPMEESAGKMHIQDTTRLRATLPTLDSLIAQGARIILGAHLGRPKGQRDSRFSLRPVAESLADCLARPVAFVDDCIGEKVEKTADALREGDVLLLENLRFHKGEEANDSRFAAQLAGKSEAYVNDAFGAAHRAHASIDALPKWIAKRGGHCVGGLLMERELRFLGEELTSPERPFVVILGGAKVSDKIVLIDRLLEKADALLIGGAMAYTFKLAKGLKVGKSLVEPDKIHLAKSAMDKASRKGIRLLLPLDHIIATPIVNDQNHDPNQSIFGLDNPRRNDSPNIPDDAEGVDIGEETIAAYCDAIQKARTILWNGPMGIFEDSRFSHGTFAIAKAVAEATKSRGAKSILGGGDSVKALNQSGFGGEVTFTSTGGGASLEFLQGRDLPGVLALDDKLE